MDNQQPSLLFKPLKEDSDYLIYEDGSLFSKKTNRFLSGKIDNVGYRVYALAISDKMSVSQKKLSKMLYTHRLVAEYFLDNPKNLPYVHHKDENKLNNHYTNLEWVTAKENSLYSKKENQIRKKPKYFIKDLEGEIWKDIPNYLNYEISNYARIRNKRTNRLLHFDKNGTYDRVNLSNIGKKKNFYVHRLVYCIFNEDYDLDNYVIDHIDGDPKNNILSNLQKITQQENCLKQERFKK